jgi:hypothetical protein
MTLEEAIAYFKDMNECTYGDVEPIQMAIEAIEKDTPKAPKKSDIPRYGMGYEYYDWYCPTCNKFLAHECDSERHRIHHCECGQRLDWGKVK